MNTLKIASCTALLALLSACANETPLMFLSKTTIGVEVSSPSAGGSETGFNIGFKAIDTAYIPVVEIVDTGKQLHVVSSSNLTASPQLSEGEPKQEDSKKSIEDAIASTSMQMTEDSKKLPGATPEQRTKLMANIKAKREVLGELARAYDSLPGRRDALSVFSVIDSNSFARSSEAGLGVGKIFATGLAAQYAAENYRTPYSACSREILQAAVALQKSTSEDDKKLATALSGICPAKK